MLCERCGKNKANVKVVKNLNNTIKELWVCSKCAKLEFTLDTNYDKDIDKLLRGFIESIIQNKSEKNRDEVKKVKCENCGTNYDYISKNWKFGCEKCYKYFGNSLNEKLSKDNIKNRHFGKFPEIEEYILSNKKRIIKLKCDLEDAIATEDYEEAANIRDKIKDLENNFREVILKNE